MPLSQLDYVGVTTKFAAEGDKLVFNSPQKTRHRYELTMDAPKPGYKVAFKLVVLKDDQKPTWFGEYSLPLSTDCPQM